ncbi:MAG: hypothetical protein EZS28_010498, partial [Streblomastix strix]
MIQINWKD